jgi:hypothetical protein
MSEIRCPGDQFTMIMNGVDNEEVVQMRNCIAAGIRIVGQEDIPYSNTRRSTVKSTAEI